MIRYKVRLVWPSFDAAYAIIPSTVLVRQVNDWLDQLRLVTGDTTWFERSDLESFFKCYRQAVDELDAHFLQIRKTRKAIFDYDLNDPGCEIDLGFGRCDEMIDWIVNEPDTDVKSAKYYKELARQRYIDKLLGRRP